MAIPYSDTNIAGVSTISTFSTIITPLSSLTMTLLSGTNYMLSWGPGDYSYVNMSWVKNGITTTQTNITASSIEVSLSDPNNNIVFTVKAYNKDNIVSSVRSINFVSVDGVAISFGSS